MSITKLPSEYMTLPGSTILMGLLLAIAHTPVLMTLVPSLLLFPLTLFAMIAIP